MRLRLVFPALILLATAIPAQSLIVVDAAGGPGTDFTDLPAAVAAARSGDHLLVRPGIYSGFAVAGKSIDVEAETEAEILGPVTVTAQRAVGTVLLRGLSIDGGAAAGLTLTDCDGAVLVQDCAVTSDIDAVVVTDCAGVTFQRSFVSGGSATAAGAAGFTGLRASGSFVSTHGGAFIGGDGGPSDCFALDVDAGPGGDGGSVVDGFLFTGGADWMGGAGGDGCENASLGCQEGGAGGNGMVVSPTGSVLELSGGFFCGGPGGSGEGCCCFGGAEGDPWTGPVGFLNQDQRLLEVFSPVQSGDTTILSLFGEEGDSALVAVGDLGPGVFLPGLNGVLGIPDPILVFAVGPTPGHVTLPAMVPSIAPAPFARIAVQALFLTAGGDKVLSGVNRLTILP